MMTQSPKLEFEPIKSRATSSMGVCVADNPMRTNLRPAIACKRSSESAKWAPRLLAAMAWISSTMTVRQVESMTRPDSEPKST